MVRRRKRVMKQRLWLRLARTVLLSFILFSFVMVLPLRWINPPMTTFMLLDSSERAPLLHEWVVWDDLGTAIPLAVVAAEDQRFADHPGLDLIAIRKAVDEKEARGYLRGASTISQQTAKNLFLWPGRSFLRKGLEAWFTIVIETCLPKRRILEIYLNVVEFGPGIYGAKAASRYFFHKQPSRLSEREAAQLAAVLPNPKRLRANPPSDYVVERQRWIEAHVLRLRKEGWIMRIQ